MFKLLKQSVTKQMKDGRQAGAGGGKQTRHGLYTDHGARSASQDCVVDPKKMDEMINLALDLNFKNQQIDKSNPQIR